MSLSICLSTNEDKDLHREYLKFYLDNDGYYWYMYPFFETIATKINQMIDLYGNAQFFNQDLNILEEQIQKVSASIKEMPDTWNVKIGEEIQPTKKDLIDSVSKAEFEKLIEKFLQVIARAKKEKKGLIFEGD